MVTDGQGLLGFWRCGQSHGIHEVNVQTVNMKCKWMQMVSFLMFSLSGTAPCISQESPQCESKLANIFDLALS